MSLILSTTESVEGYVVTEYLGCVSGSGSYLPGGAIGEGFLGEKQSTMFTGAYQEALLRMKDSVRGRADAIIGIRSSVCSMNGPLAYILVTVTGTAVKLDKILEPLPVTESMKKRREEETRLEREEAEKAARRLEWQQSRAAAAEEGEKVDIEALLRTLKALDSASEMMEQVRAAEAADPTLFPPELIEQLEKNIEIGRKYGRRVGAQNFIKQLEQFLEGN